MSVSVSVSGNVKGFSLISQSVFCGDSNFKRKFGRDDGRITMMPPRDSWNSKSSFFGLTWVGSKRLASQTCLYLYFVVIPGLPYEWDLKMHTLFYYIFLFRRVDRNFLSSLFLCVCVRAFELTSSKKNGRSSESCNLGNTTQFLILETS